MFRQKKLQKILTQPLYFALYLSYKTKEATMSKTLQTIKNRKSCRKYQDVKLSPDEITTILHAGLQAPSSMNRQQMFITAVTNKEIVNQLTKEITLALDKHEDYSCFYHAPCIVIVSGPKTYSALKTDGSCILQNMFLAATDLQIGSCWINQLGGIEDIPKIRKILNMCNIPDDHLVCGCASLGYADGPMTPKEKHVNRIQIID